MQHACYAMSITGLTAQRRCTRLRPGDRRADITTADLNAQRSMAFMISTARPWTSQLSCGADISQNSGGIPGVLGAFSEGEAPSEGLKDPSHAVIFDSVTSPHSSTTTYLLRVLSPTVQQQSLRSYLSTPFGDQRTNRSITASPIISFTDFQTLHHAPSLPPIWNHTRDCIFRARISVWGNHLN